MKRNKKKNNPSSPPAPAPQRPNANGLKAGLMIGVLGILSVLLGWWWTQRHLHLSVERPQAGPGEASRFALADEKSTFAEYAGSATCRDCHQAAYEKWSHSHHALAERPMNAQSDRDAFEPPRELMMGSQTSQIKMDGDKFEIITAGLKSSQETFKPERVIGVDPLRQFLIPADGGRWQTAELSFDPHKKEWFDVFGNEDRHPGEWGHWTGRGMTWNQMCASCHNTRVRKNYDDKLDKYSTHMAEMSVGCEACHGPMRSHVDWQKAHTNQGKDPTLAHFTTDQVLDTCGSCHARRGELTGDFKPGDKFLDHYQLSIPDESEIFYADGQIHEEDYEFTSFLSSKMHGAGVRCKDCHESHTAKTILPGNLLCLRCHGAPVPPAPRIEEAAHTFHKSGSPGSQCVNCHMPETTYMQRHARRDHGFTTPDPLLTKQLGIPNACNRCHQDKTADWALENCQKWHGDKMNRPTRDRAQWIAAARAESPGSYSNLLRILATEKNPLWRAAAANLLRNHAGEPGVIGMLVTASRDTNAIVRAMAVRSLDEATARGDASARQTTSASLNDPIRSVRAEAAWLLRRSIETNSLAGSELLHQLQMNIDQPLGLMRWGDFLTDRGNSGDALSAYRRAVDLDPGSPPLRHTYAVALSQAGNGEEAIKQLTEACRLAPRDAHFRFTLALAFNEVGRSFEATATLEEAVRLDPHFGRAWYNLGLAYNSAGKPGQALEALARAQAVEPRDPAAWYAAATILVHDGRISEARESAARALRLDPRYPGAAELLNSLPPPEK